MSCCTTGVADLAKDQAASGRAAADTPPETIDVTPYVQPDGQGRNSLALMVEGIHCGGCVKTIERELGAMAGVEERPGQHDHPAPAGRLAGRGRAGRGDGAAAGRARLPRGALRSRAR
ncbi:MAG: heavy metal-associated domain-containing protein [Rhodovibrio sp.]|nr:heavy metal-associated domain-containing protein [Rhodovibrio sp.]